MPYKTSRKLPLIHPKSSRLLLRPTLSTEIELNPGPASFSCGSCGFEVLDDDFYPYLVTIVNIGTTFSARTYQLELMIPYRAFKM